MILLMAGYKGHIAGATVFYSAYIGLLLLLLSVGIWAQNAGMLQGWQTLGGMLIVAILFGLFPDIDTNSKGQDIFFAVLFGLDILLIINELLELAAYVGLMSMLPILGKHRGWTHTFWAMLVVPLPIIIVPYLYDQTNLTIAMLYYGAAVVGYFSHLFFDGLVLKRLKQFAH